MSLLNGCRACGDDFSSVDNFDRHRVGLHEYTHAEGLRMEPPREDGRRCLDAEEMHGLGWEKNGQGRWHDPVRTEKARKAFAGPENRSFKRAGASS